MLLGYIALRSSSWPHVVHHLTLFYILLWKYNNFSFTIILDHRLKLTFSNFSESTLSRGSHVRWHVVVNELWHGYFLSIIVHCFIPNVQYKFPLLFMKIIDLAPLLTCLHTFSTDFAWVVIAWELLHQF